MAKAADTAWNDASLDRCDYAQLFLARSPAYRRGCAALNTATRQAKEDFARLWGLRFPLRSR